MAEKKLGFGLMRLPRLDPDDAKSIDLEQLKKMVDLFLENGFTYFDTAWMYCAFKSEESIREALVKRYPRDSYTLATKLHAGYFNSAEEREAMFEEQLRRTGAGFFDYYLLHNASSDNYKKFEELDCFAWVAEKKKQGLVREVGLSIHDTPEVLDKILTAHPELDFVQLQLNYLDWNSLGIRSRELYETARKHNKPIVVMEPVKGGLLANIPGEAEKLLRKLDPDSSVPSWALRFVTELPGVKMVLSGMSTLAQMEDNLAIMADPKPLTEEEHAALRRVVEIINGDLLVPCTGCSYCTEGCPAGIPIPQYFSLYNEDGNVRPVQGWSPQLRVYQGMIKVFASPEDCVGCGQCESICPQHLTIPEELKKVAAYFA